MNESVRATCPEIVGILNKIEKDLHSIDISLGILAGTTESREKKGLDIPNFMLCKGEKG